MRLLQELASKQIRLTLEGETLRANGPLEQLTASLRDDLKRHKPELIAMLRQSSVASPSDEAAASRCAGEAQLPRSRASTGEAAAGVRSPGPQVGPGVSTCLRRRPDGQAFPTLPNQRRLLRLEALRAPGSLYNIPLAFSLAGALELPSFMAALADVQTRHEALRMTFPNRGSLESPSVSLFPIDSSVEFHPCEASNSSDAFKELRRQLCRPFNTSEGPLWRSILVTIGKREQLLGFAFHHTIFDGFSRRVFLTELAECYEARLRGQPPDYRRERPQFGDFAAWSLDDAQQRRHERDGHYWNSQFTRVVAPLKLPAEFRFAAGETDMAGVVSTRRAPQVELGQRLAACSRAWRTTPAAVLLAALAATLQRHTGQTDLLVCLPLANRDTRGTEEMIGFLNTAAPLLIQADPGQTCRQLVAAVNRQALAAASHSWIDLDQWTHSSFLSRAPLNRLLFSYQESLEGPLLLGGQIATALPVRKDAADFGMAFQCEMTASGLAVDLDCDSRLFTAGAADQFLERWQAVLTTVLDDPDTALRNLPTWGLSDAALREQLEQLPQVDEAAVQTDAASGEVDIWVVLNEHTPISLPELRQRMADWVPTWRLPRSVTPVDQLTRDESGQIDFGPLRALTANRQRNGSAANMPVRSPRTDLERQLVELWREVLWLDQAPSIDDSFQELGGHSLLAVRMIQQLELSLRRRLPTAAVRNLSTIACFAEALAEVGPIADDGREDDQSDENQSDDQEGRQEGHKDDNRVVAMATSREPLPDVLRGLNRYVGSWNGWRRTPESLIVGLNVGGERPPLFWCLQNQFELRQLARYLGPDQPVYGMRSGNEVMVKDQANIDRLGAFYADEIGRICPSGNLLVGGNCQAAWIAFRVAVELRHAGREIPLLFLHEKFVPQPYDGAIAMTFGRQSDRNPYLDTATPEEQYRQFYSGSLSIDLVRGSHGRFFKEPNVQDFVRVIALRRDICLSIRKTLGGDALPCPRSGMNGWQPPRPAAADSSTPISTWTGLAPSTTDTCPETGIGFWKTFTSLFTKSTR